MRNSILKLSLGLLASWAIGTANVKAGSAFFNLNTQPTNGPSISDFWLVGDAVWASSLGAGAVTNGAGPGVVNDGFIQLTMGNGQSSAALFPDFDKGLVVKAFTFQCMIKLGDWTSGTPADGFSVNYAAANDPIIQTIASGTNPGRGSDPNGWAGSQDNGGTEIDLPEEGTQTGLGIGFDTWGNLVGAVGNQSTGGANGGGDLRGISIRVNGKQLTQIAMPNANPYGNNYDYTTDPTSLITGPPDAANPGDGALLNWVPLKCTMDDQGNLNVFWKGHQIVTNLVTGFFPIAGRIVFGASTGGANEFAGVDNIQILTVPATNVVFSGATADYSGYTIKWSNSGQSVAQTNSISVTIDGTNTYSAAQLSTVGTDTNGITTAQIIVFPATALASGSTHTIDATIKDNFGTTVSVKGIKVTVKPYSFLPPQFALDASTVTNNPPGFLVRAYQVQLDRNANNNDRSDAMLAGELGPNFANISTFTDKGYLDEPAVINYPSGSVPGIDVPAPSTGAPNPPNGQTDDIALDFTTVLYLATPGSYTMGVNSDDGFRIYAGTNILDRFNEGNVIVGEFNGGRGRGDTLINFVVTKAGYYPFRCTYENGTGGYGINWFTVMPDGTHVDINDATSPIKAYRMAAQSKAYIKSVVPGAWQEVYNPTGGVQIVVVDAGTKFVAGSAKLNLDGTDVTSSTTVNSASGTTTVSYNPGPFAWLSTHAVTFTYGETGTPTNTTRTVNFSFTIRTPTPDDLPTNSFWIEAEDWDIAGGQTIASASTMPYGGGAYESATAGNDTSRFGIDYHNDDGFDSQTYRAGGDLNVTNANSNNGGIQNVDTTDNKGGQFGTWRPGGFIMNDDWRIGWIGGGDWGNFTRTVPPGVYGVYAAMSWGGDALGASDKEFGSLDVVTKGWGTANQSTLRLGRFDAPSSGNWGDNYLIPMHGADGSPAAIKLGGTNTLRFNSDQGDFDWFVLTPTTSPPKVISAAPGPNGQGVNQPSGYGVGVPRTTPIDITIANLTTSVATNTIKVLANGQDITSSAVVSISTPIPGDGSYVLVHVPYTWPVGTNNWTINFSDNGSPAKQISSTVSFLVDPRGSPGQFLIEAEDFDFNGGSTTNVASTMPYTGGAYNGLSAKFGVDYADHENQDSEQYRTGGDLHVAGQGANMDPGPGDLNRGSWTNSVNHKIGWIGSDDWYNYTRTFPTNDYFVYAALSHGNSAGELHDLKGSIGVVSAGVGTTNQTVLVMGSCDAPSSGSWGVNDLVAMTDTNGVPITVHLGGTQTVQYQGSSGDYDYLLFVPGKAAPPPLKFSGVQVSGTSLVITWSGGGTLQQSTTGTGGWTAVAGNPTSPASILIGLNKTLYFRIQQ